MSAETRKAVEDAIAAHMSDEQEATLTGWALVAAGKRIDQIEDGNTMYVMEADDTLAYHSVLGLAQYLVDDIRKEHRDWGSE